MNVRIVARAAGALLALLLAGCSTLTMPSLPPLSSFIPPPPNFDWLFGKSNKPGPLPDVKGDVAPRLRWQASVGKASAGFAPAATSDAVFVASADGTVLRVDLGGKTVWSANAGRTLSAGPGSDGKIVAVGSDKGDVVALDALTGKEKWTAHVSSEVMSPPIVTESEVIVFSGDGRIFALALDDGKTRWTYQRTNPPLTVRNNAGGVVHRGGLFIGTAGGHLLALDVENGSLGWDVAVATPKGATELERIADVTSLPVIDDQAVCAAAYQGRMACFELVRGSLVWSRDIASLGGLVGDERNIYVTDDKGSVQALDRSTGASVWKQDVLAQRRIGGPQLLGSYLAVVDVEGYVHLLSREDGKYLGRLATDGAAPTSQPVRVGDDIAWQSEKGGVFVVTTQ